MKATVYVRLKNDVLDPQVEAVKRALGTMGFEGAMGVRNGKLVELELDECSRSRCAPEGAGEDGRRATRQSSDRRLRSRLRIATMLPFARLNLRWNPFGEVSSRDRGQLAVVGFDVERIVAQLAAPGFAIELLGPCGRGKSTHLYALHTRFPELPVTYVDVGARPRIPCAPVVFVDESQHLSLRARRRLFRRRASFVLATHESHIHELAAAGVQCETFRVGGVDPLRVRAMVARRLEWARLGPGPLPTVPDVMLQELAREHSDDLRAIGDALYDWVQVLKRRAHGEL